jgi:hypothetical protein
MLIFVIMWLNVEALKHLLRSCKETFYKNILWSRIISITNYVLKHNTFLHNPPYDPLRWSREECRFMASYRI